jgi:hypothetical protein
MRIIAFITDGPEVRKILEHIGVDVASPRITPARGPPLWDACDAPVGDVGDVGDGVRAVPDCKSEWNSDWDMAAQPAPDDQPDQRLSW